MKLIAQERDVAKTSKSARMEPMAEGITYGRKPMYFYAKMSDDELSAFSKAFITEMGLHSRSEMRKADESLYQTVRRRGLLNGLGLETNRRKWDEMDDIEVIGFALELIRWKKIPRKADLKAADIGLYNVLVKRKLMDETCLGDSRGQRRGWSSLTSDEIVGQAKALIEKMGITSRSGLDDADERLYKTLLHRKLLDAVGLESSHCGYRDWDGACEEDVLKFCSAFISENGILGKEELRKADPGLHSTLSRRKLLDAIFSDADSSKRIDAVDGVIDALGSFDDDRKVG